MNIEERKEIHKIKNFKMYIGDAPKSKIDDKNQIKSIKKQQKNKISENFFISSGTH